MIRNKPLGDFLRSRRDRLDPLKLGFLASRRRTPGLRREEVAQRAGISSEWYVKLEQGREASASPQTIAAIARALVLTPAETAHLHRLASGPTLEAFKRETVPREVVDSITKFPEPAYVTGALWDVLVWNDAAEVLFNFSRLPEQERNILLWMFKTPAARNLFAGTWTAEAKRMVALFRASYDQRIGDAAFGARAAYLNDVSAEFRKWWPLHDIGVASSGSKTLCVDGITGIVYNYTTFQSNDDPALKLALYTRG